MPLDKKGSYHANPATARMHDAAEPATQPDPAGTATGGAHEVHIHAPNHPETGDGQNYHVRVHHMGGNVEESKHPDVEGATDHAKAAFGEPSDEADPNEQEPDGDSDDASGNESSADEEY